MNTMLIRLLIPFYFIVIVMAGIISSQLLPLGLVNVGRFCVGASFLVGAAVSMVGYWRYLPRNDHIPALLLLLIGKNVVMVMLGVAFFIGAATSVPTVTHGPYIEAIYGLYGAAGAAQLFTGLFVYIGAGRGWITEEIPKKFWRSDEKR